jgi:hypothetical protein
MIAGVLLFGEANEESGFTEIQLDVIEYTCGHPTVNVETITEAFDVPRSSVVDTLERADPARCSSRPLDEVWL